MNIVKSIPSQRKQLYRLFGYDKETEALHVANVTGNKSVSAKDLTMHQATNLIKTLTCNWAVFDAKNTQHRYIMSLMQQIGWSKPHPTYNTVADMARLNNFLKSKKSPVNKPLQNMNKTELSKLISCFESMQLKANS